MCVCVWDNSLLTFILVPTWTGSQVSWRATADEGGWRSWCVCVWIHRSGLWSSASSVVGLMGFRRGQVEARRHLCRHHVSAYPQNSAQGDSDVKGRKTHREHSGLINHGVCNKSVGGKLDCVLVVRTQMQEEEMLFTPACCLHWISFIWFTHHILSLCFHLGPFRTILLSSVQLMSPDGFTCPLVVTWQTY